MQMTSLFLFGWVFVGRLAIDLYILGVSPSTGTLMKYTA